MGDILKGRIPNKLVPLKHKVDGRWVDLGLGTISPIRDDAGNVQLRIFTRLDEPQYKISPYKELFTDKEIERLETDGHLGSTKKMKDFTSGRECECYVSVHEATNRLTTLPVDALTLPTRIYGKEIGDDIEALRSGKEIFIEDIHLKDGRVISGHARVDANRGDVVFRNDNNPHLRIHDTVFGVKYRHPGETGQPRGRLHSRHESRRQDDQHRPSLQRHGPAPVRQQRPQLPFASGRGEPASAPARPPASSVASRRTTQRHENRLAVMKRHVEENELPYFAATLTAYLRESHPELLSDKHFIAERSDHAAQTYERAVRNGNSVYEALELSNAVLYQDLRFSKYDAIFEVVSEWFPEVAARQRTAFCLKLLPVCEEAFEMYDLTDDFESSPSYKNLLLELTGLIQTHIELHGIQ